MKKHMMRLPDGPLGVTVLEQDELIREIRVFWRKRRWEDGAMNLLPEHLGLPRDYRIRENPVPIPRVDPSGIHTQEFLIGRLNTIIDILNEHLGRGL